MDQQVGIWFQKQIAKAFEQINEDSIEKANPLLYQLMKKGVELAIQDTRLHFSTMFSSLAYLKSFYNVPTDANYILQNFRRNYKKTDKKLDLPKCHAMIWALDQFTHSIWKVPPKYETLKPSHIDFGKPLQGRFENYVKGIMIGAAEEKDCFLFIREDQPTIEYKVFYNIPDHNDIFTDNILQLIKNNSFPVGLGLYKLTINESGQYLPKAFVIEPDLLIDVTSISSSFTSEGKDILPYFLNKFTPSTQNIYLLKGNIANLILDRLVYDFNTSFESILQASFARYPLDFAVFEDHEILTIQHDCLRYYQNIKRSLAEEFSSEKIDLNSVRVEPSFYNPHLGLQGRLDLLGYQSGQSTYQIVELKSSKIYKPNRYGLNASHYMQTLVYDLLLKNSFSKDQVLAYVMYATDDKHALRNAPVATELQMEALYMRNRIVLMERFLASLQGIEKEIAFFKKFKTDHFFARGFLRRDLSEFSFAFGKLTPLEQKYFIAFVGFLTREYLFSKIGQESAERNRGLAAIWRDGMEEKVNQYALLHQLKLVESKVSEDHTIAFLRTEATDPLANFREGDAIILFAQAQIHHPTQGQIFKGSIVEIDDHQLRIRLRNVQLDEDLFAKGTHWCVQHDLMESSFRKSMNNLAIWMHMEKHRRRLFLGLESPHKTPYNDAELFPYLDTLTQEQRNILQKMHYAQDYFLLWGPPGTGKTSVMLKNYVFRKLKHSTKRLFLFAFTNRAVDEICHQLKALQKVIEFQFLRIGSSFSTDIEFQPYLMQEKCKEVKSRKELLKLLNDQQVYVATVSSYLGKRSILDLIEFDEAIVDEASQLLEPMMTPIFNDFRKCILIGDHKQLPAVVQQDEYSSKTKDRDLQEIGLENLRNSLFERLFLLAEKQQWNWAYDVLKYQGRMHKDLVAFPSQYFYHQNLRILDHIPAVKEQLQEKLSDYSFPSDLQYPLDKSRLLFADAGKEHGLYKISHRQAQITMEFIHDFRKLYAQNQWSWDGDTLGVIVPFRAQIGLIKQQLWALNEEWAKNITVDTVERYQGGARDIIICNIPIHHESEWASITSVNFEGVDRKLNVALTRARKYFVWTANTEIVNSNKVYHSLKAASLELS